jgi:3-oxoacyl-[acyl-carrier protein] reductase
MATRSGSIDISFNLTSFGDVQGTPLVEMPLADYAQPVVTVVKTTFLTSRAAARHMIQQGSGVILFSAATAIPLRTWADFRSRSVQSRRSGAASPANSARMASAWSRYRRVGFPSRSRSPSTGATRSSTRSSGRPCLGAVTLDDVGNVAAFAASDYARKMTATALNITSGTEVD